MNTFTRDGLFLRYDDTGGDGPAMVFLHGMACNRSDFGAQVVHFSDRFRCVALDQRGHGDSDKPLDVAYTHDVMAGDVVALCEHLGLHDIVLVGHSLGAAVATRVAVGRPDLVRALVVLDAVYEDGPRADEVRARLGRFLDSLDPARYRETLSEFLSGILFGRGDPPELRARVLEKMTSCPMEIYVALSRDIVATDPVAVAERVSVPVLSVTGENPLTPTDEIRRRFPSWFVGQVVGAGHFVHLSGADQVNTMIERFLDLSSAGR